jgi:hypothetical protein
VSLVDLNKMLDAGVPPIDLERFMGDVARQTGRYDQFVRTEAVRRLNEYFSQGFGKSERQQYGLASGWAMWACLFEPLHKRSAREAWDLIESAMRHNPHWCPSSPDDELIVGAFRGRSFAPTGGAEKLAAAVRRMEKEIGRDNTPFRHTKAARNLRRVPRGYGWLYGLYAVDGQVCNGGFVQYYENTGGWPTAFAAEAFREIGHVALADIVEESLMSAMLYHPDVIADGIDTPEHQKSSSPRWLEELDAAYYAAKKSGEPEWLEIAITELLLTRGADF